MSFKERFFSAARSVTKTEPLVAGDFAVRGGQIEVLNQQALSDRAVLYSLFVEQRARNATGAAGGTQHFVHHDAFRASRFESGNPVETLKEILAGISRSGAAAGCTVSAC